MVFINLREKSSQTKCIPFCLRELSRGPRKTLFCGVKINRRFVSYARRAQ